ncbi:hypothetical protein Hrubri_1028 [Herbaspirillum rubrisubalbicans M1]|uniref:hypothetical protein n=1 Tax=Herbaspirillum rubrisubalbicans TaxID=80842 RepID=UPI00073A8D50|nr:hypothetical protein [Herbaspirillum rubrisubalbicans]ALU88244.1 hypothetical protein Hrubri_1028 [Herbaspirillum rubrisubalbicans M1]
MGFDRGIPFFGKTLAWRLFKRHHTHFNVGYWANEAAVRYAFSSTKPFTRDDQSTKLFSLSNNPRRLPKTLGEWADGFSDFNQWTQLASVIAISGYLETYIAQVSTAALESRPALIFGGSFEVDGAALLKAGNKHDFYDHVESLVRGDWQSRISGYTKLFGSCPFEAEIANLERLRKLRNDAGHTFGRDIKSMRFAESSIVQSLPRIKTQQIQEFLKLAESVASTIEQDVGLKYVGAYESIRLFHI